MSLISDDEQTRVANKGRDNNKLEEMPMENYKTEMQREKKIIKRIEQAIQDL